jgi:hypothetical protein
MKKYRQSVSVAIGLLTLVALGACSSPETNNLANNSQTTKSPTATPADKPTSTPTPTTATSPTPSAEISWQDYQSALGKFSLQVPGKPQEQSQEQTTEAGKVKVTMVVTEANNSGYFVGYADVPDKSAAPVDAQKSLAESIKSLVANINGELKLDQEYKLGTFPCRDFDAAGKVQATDVIMKGRFCIAENRMYQVFAIGSKENLDPKDAKRFIDSFKINN